MVTGVTESARALLVKMLMNKYVLVSFSAQSITETTQNYNLKEEIWLTPKELVTVLSNMIIIKIMLMNINLPDILLKGFNDILHLNHTTMY